MNKKILIVEDDKNIAKLVKYNLENNLVLTITLSSRLAYAS